MVAQKLEDAALAQAVTLPQFGGRRSIAVGLDQFGNQLIAEALIQAVRWW
ncbi:MULTISPECIES: hypothetical protein [unclassified Mycolicibacterium]|nr:MULTISPECIES: hypothetical protein [unclassified Mycolicibacterium]